MTRRETEMVCAKCGSDRINVEFTADGHGHADIEVDGKGKPYVAYISERDYHHEEHENFSCAACKASWYPLEKGLKPKQQAGINLLPGDLVFLPDGFKAKVATVDPETNTFTVEGWHETFQAGEGEPVIPIVLAAA